MHRAVIVSLLGALIAPVAKAGDGEPAVAQAALTEGSRVRIVASGKKPVVGRLVKADDDHLVLQRGDEILSVALSQVSRIEVSRGRARGKAAGIGGLIGVGLGAAFIVAALVDDRVCPSEGCLILAGEISFAGGVLGIMVGGQVAPERWSPHALPSVPAVSAGPVSLAIGASSRGASLRMTLRF